MKDIKETIKKLYREGTLKSIGTHSGFPVVEHEGNRYYIQGDKRLRVVEFKNSQPKIKKQKVVAEDHMKICKECGKEFKVSKFNPYFDICHNCRSKSRRKADPQPKPCIRCGKEFIPNKFNPNTEHCKMCWIELKAKAKEEKDLFRINLRIQGVVAENNHDDGLESAMMTFARDKFEDGVIPSTPMLAKFAREYIKGKEMV